MLKLTRTVGSLDTSRLGNAARAPGIDPRVWTSLAYVQGVTADPAEGVFVDVILVPSMIHTTARLGAEYAGAGFGLYAPLRVDDEVLVEVPSGDLDHGAVITRRLHSPSDPPPSEVQDHGDDLVLVVKPGQSFRVVVSGGGTVVLGAAVASDAAIRGTTYRAAEDAYFSAANALSQALAQMTTALAAAAPSFTGSPTQILAFATAVAAVQDSAAALASTIATFNSGAPSYLSDSVEVAP